MSKPTTIGLRIRQERERRGLTQEDLSALTKIERAHISRIENGHTSPGLVTLATLAKALRTSSAKLLSA